MKILLTTEIAAPVERVFEVFTDIPNAAAQLDGLESVEMLSDGPFAVGTRWRETRQMFGKSATEEMWVTSVADTSSYVVEAESHGTHYVSTYNFEQIDPANTRVRLEFEGRPVATIAKLMVPLGVVFKRATVKAFRADLDQLKAYCES